MLLSFHTKDLVSYCGDRFLSVDVIVYTIDEAVGAVGPGYVAYPVCMCTVRTACKWDLCMEYIPCLETNLYI